VCSVYGYWSEKTNWASWELGELGTGRVGNWAKWELGEMGTGRIGTGRIGNIPLFCLVFSVSDTILSLAKCMQ
jgi:hypothetical protein